MKIRIGDTYTCIKRLEVHTFGDMQIISKGKKCVLMRFSDKLTIRSSGGTWFIITYKEFTRHFADMVELRKLKLGEIGGDK